MLHITMHFTENQQNNILGKAKKLVLPNKICDTNCLTQATYTHNS